MAMRARTPRLGILGVTAFGAATLFTAALSSRVMAQEPELPETSGPRDKAARWADRGAASLLLQGGWGIGADDEGFGDANQPSNAYAVGLGVKGGYTFPFKLYLGARFGHYFGRDGYERFYPADGLNVSNGI